MKKLFYENAWKLAAFFGVMAFAFWLANFAAENVAIGEAVYFYGYWGVFLLSVVSGFNLAVPIPAVSFVPLFFEAGLNVWISVLVIVFGVTLADFISFFIGKAGRYFAGAEENSAAFKKFEKWRIKYHLAPLAVLFLFASFVPFPNEVLLVPLGFMGYKTIHVAVPLLLGNAIFNTLAAFGLLNLSRYIL